jgi:hypothetical protein
VVLISDFRRFDASKHARGHYGKAFASSAFSLMKFAAAHLSSSTTDARALPFADRDRSVDTGLEFARLQVPFWTRSSPHVTPLLLG